MPSIKMVIAVEIDGVSLPGFPLTRRLETTEAQALNISKANDGVGVYVTLPTVDQLPIINALVVQAIDQAITLRLNNQSDAGITLNAGGLIAIIDAVINSGATTNAKVNNASGSNALVRGVAAGT